MISGVGGREGEQPLAFIAYRGSGLRRERLQ